MANFAIIQNNVIANVIVHDPATVQSDYPGAIRIDTLNPEPGIGWSYSGGVFSAPTPAPAPPPSGTIFKRQAFMDLFTDSEIQACVNVASSITATAPQKAAIAAVLFKFQSAENIDIAKANVIGGVELLEAAGLLNTGRAAEILATRN